MINPILIDVPESFETERLTIRVPRPGDGPRVLAAVSESLAEFRKFPGSMPWAERDYPLESAELFCRNACSSFIARQGLTYLLIERSSGLVAGCTGFHRIDWTGPRLEVGYWCRTSLSGKGFITEAVRALTAFALDGLGAQRVEIMADEENIRSWRVCERCGYTLEGTLRNERRASDGSLRNMRLYARVPPAAG